VAVYYSAQLDNKFVQVSCCFKKCHVFSYTHSTGSSFLYCDNKS